MNYLATTARRLARPNAINAMRTTTRSHIASGASAEGMKARRMNSSGQRIPIRDGELDDDGRAMLQRTVTRPATGSIDHCTDPECKWFCKQNKLAHYIPYPVETYQATELCPNSWARAGASFNTFYCLLFAPGFIALTTDFRAEHLRYKIDDVMFKGFRDKETDDHRDLKKCRGWGGYFDIQKMTHGNGIPHFACGGSGEVFLQKPYGGIGNENEDLIKMARYKYVRIS